MSNGPLTKLGVVRCRDLVQMFLGARVAANVRESSPNLPANTVVELIPADPRRIKYEISIQNAAATTQFAIIGPAQAFTTGVAMTYALAPGTGLVFSREWRNDLDAVTQQLLCESTNSGISINVRETFLTPLPVDEPV